MLSSSLFPDVFCRYSLSVDWSAVADEVSRSSRGGDRLSLDEDCLRWTPPVHSDDDDDDDDAVVETDGQVRDS